MKNTIKPIIGYIWAGLSIPVMLFFVFFNGFLTDKLFINNGVTISKNLTGNKISRTVQHKNYQTIIHEPVFEGYFKENKNGFIQIDWIQSSDQFPEVIKENIDFDNDKKIDFNVNLNTIKNKVKIVPLNKNVISLSYENLVIYEKKFCIRVNINKE